jgi:YVTN family beta-propeller protein
MKRNAIHWGLLALSLLCGGALYVETTSSARAQAPKSPWGTVVATVAGAGSVLINPNTNAAYFAPNYTANQIVVLDGTTNKITGQIPVPAGASPGWFDARQDRLYANSGLTVTIIDTKKNSVIDTIALVQPQGVPAGRGTTFIAVNSATGKLYGGFDLESPGIGPGLMAVWDLATGALIETISIDFPQNATINPKTNRVYVTDNFSSQLVVVDGVTNAVIDRIQTGQAYFPDGCYVLGPCITQASSPWGVSVSEKTNRIYVDDIEDGTVYVIDGNTDRVIGGPITVGQGVTANSLDDVHDVLYLPNAANATVSALDLKTMKPLGAPVLIGTPPSPPGCQLFAVDSNCTDFGSFPQYVTVNPANNKIYATEGFPGVAVVVQGNRMKHEDHEARE